MHAPNGRLPREQAVTNVAMRLRVKIWPWLSSPWAMVIAALALRLVVMGFVYTDRLDPARDHWTFGWETGRVARSIAAGQGFSSPYPEPTGPTTLVPPAYTYLVAGVFRLFGIYTPSSALVMLTINNLFSSLTCLPVFFITRRVFGLSAAVWAGWIWAFFPYAIALANVTVWETTLTTLLFSLVVLATLRLERSTSWSAWLSYGALWGIAALSNPAVLSTLPFLGAWLWIRHWRRGENCTGVAVAASLVVLVTIAPWIWRCSQVYGRFVAFRGSVGLEVLVGSSDDTSSSSNFKVLPGNNPAEMEKVRRLGEPAYMAEKQREAREAIARRPLRFAGLTLRRILQTWTDLWDSHPRWTLDEAGLPNVLTYSFVSLLAFAGLHRAIQDRRDGVIPLVIPLVFLPVAYYLTHFEIRYRHPIDPLVAVFMAYGAIAFRGRKLKLSG
jgi:4-amino-4-deoxy-L-arabinose transferase-like glycosyltransferase